MIAKCALILCCLEKKTGAQHYQEACYKYRTELCRNKASRSLLSNFCIQKLKIKLSQTYMIQRFFHLCFSWGFACVSCLPCYGSTVSQRHFPFGSKEVDDAVNPPQTLGLPKIHGICLRYSPSPAVNYYPLGKIKKILYSWELTNIAPEKRAILKGKDWNLPTIHFQVLC